MAGTSEGGKKAAKTRKQQDPKAFERMGQKGGSNRGKSGSRQSNEEEA